MMNDDRFPTGHIDYPRLFVVILILLSGYVEVRIAIAAFRFVAHLIGR